MAIPIEVANVFLKDSSIDLRISFGAISLDKLLSDEYQFLHWPGIYFSNWLEGIGFSRVGLLAVVASGYLDTVILLIAVIFIFRALPRRRSRRSLPPDEPMEI